MRSRLLLLLAALALLVTGCSSDGDADTSAGDSDSQSSDSDTDATGDPSGSAGSDESDPGGSGAPDGTELEPVPPGGSCLSGVYDVLTINGTMVFDGDPIAVSSDSSLTLTFTADAFSITDDGTIPLLASVGSSELSVTVQGSLTGTYSLSGTDIALVGEDSSGEISLNGEEYDETYSMDVFAEALAPDSRGTLTCAADGTALLQTSSVIVDMAAV